MMDLGEIPPVIVDTSETKVKTVARWRWWPHLLVLSLLTILPGIQALVIKSGAPKILPDSISGLLRVCAYGLATAALIFSVAWLFSRANARQLYLHWRGGGLPVILGLGYSIALRFAIMFVVFSVVAIWMLLHGSDAAAMERFRPHTGRLLNADALARSPAYLLVCLTLVSFVIAGLREELWRAGMFSGIAALYPNFFGSWRGKAISVTLVSLLFGFGHLYQGWMGVGITSLIGAGLGAVMLLRRSTWEAAIAHGFFDASTFALLYLVAKYQPDLLRNF